MSDKIKGAQIALETAVEVLRVAAKQADDHGNADTCSFVNAAASIVGALDPAAVIERHEREGKGAEAA